MFEMQGRMARVFLEEPEIIFRKLPDMRGQVQ
jgi:hypothetical protein